MTQNEKDRLQYIIDVMQAYKEGKEIECMRIDIIGDDWTDALVPIWDWGICNYRVKPEPPKPKYRPFKNTNELMDAVKEHGDIVIAKCSVVYRKITTFSPYDVNFGTGAMEYKDAYAAYIFADGAPFGKLIEE